MANRIDDLVHDVMAAPLGDMIAAVGEGVAEAQAALDEGSIAKTLEIYQADGDQALEVLRSIGYRPTFYALPETTGELRVSLSLGNAAQSPGAASGPAAGAPSAPASLSRLASARRVAIRPYAAPVNAGFANRYAYNAELSAKLTFKIVPVPAPDGADELRVVPDLTGKPVAEASAIAEGLGLKVEVQDSAQVPIDEPDDTATVIAQDRPADSIARLGDSLRLTVG